MDWLKSFYEKKFGMDFLHVIWESVDLGWVLHLKMA